MSVAIEDAPGKIISPPPTPTRIQTVRYRCPKPGCDTVSKTKRGIRQHATRMHGERLTKLLMACQHCRDTFYAKHSRQDTARYCSYDCKSEADDLACEPEVVSEPPSPVEALVTRFRCPIEDCDHLSKTEHGSQHHITTVHPDHAGATLECERCGSTFHRKSSAISYARFCSEECRDRSRRRRVTLSCDFCGEEFWTHECRKDIARFCSVECHYFGVLAHPIAWCDPDEVGLTAVGQRHGSKPLSAISKEAITNVN